MYWLASDVLIYFSLANSFILTQDYASPYPPGALLVFLFPRLFTSDFPAYFLFFSLLMFALFFVKLLLLIRIKGAKRDDLWLLFLIVSGVMMLPLALVRFDLIPSVLTLAAIILFLRNRPFWPEFFLALGTLVKIFPVVLLPLLVIHFWVRGEKIRLFKGLLVYFFTLVIFLAPFIFLDGGRGIVSDLNYQLRRPVEIESLPASVLFAGALGGAPATTFFAAGSHNVTLEGWDGLVNNLFTLFWIAGLALSYFWFFLQSAGKSFSSRELPPKVVKGSLLVLLIFVAFRPVFSPQYLIWLEPLVLWFLLYVSRKKMIFLGSLWCLTLFLTIMTLVFWGNLVALSPSAILIQILRNGLFLFFLAVIFTTRPENIPVTFSHPKS
ncbi:MAG: glycosyltransferase 87 family protein [bacterium]|nr:glycosyltransferase 87 family protein [bacterium]